MIKHQTVSSILKLFIASVFLCGVASCSTKKNTLSRRLYHNLTARYNVYFNGKEAYKAGVLVVQDKHKDNFTDIIPMYLSSDKEACAGASSNMDRAIEKSSKLIKKHSITARPKQQKNVQLNEQQKEFYAKKDYCNWVDDAYLLMGKAHLYKHDYFSSQKNFSYVMNEFKTAGLRVPAAIWLARAKAEEGMHDDAEEVLDKIIDEQNFPSKYKADHAAAYANTLIKARKYKEAIPRLEEAINLTKNKKTKVRYSFILAQLYQKTNNHEKSLDLFAQTIKMGAPYDMEFNAKINLATSYEKGNSQQIKKMLGKLLKDEKNNDFQDQIYFALANIAYKEGDVDKALDLYKKSVEKSVSNKYQKAMSFLAIGEIYYDKKKYIVAQPYYDSCVTTLSEDYPDFATLSTKSKNLNELADNHKIVLLEDSLLRMSKMSPQERNAIIDERIKAIAEQEAAQQRAEQEAAIAAALAGPVIKASDATATSWYFYNPTSVRQGKAEFVKAWGTRKLEDDWRRKNKAVVENNEADTSSIDDSLKTKKTVLTNKSRDFYLQDLPSSDSAANASAQRMELAFYNMGTIFMNKISDNGEAITTFEEFAKRFPKSEYLVMVYYYLFMLHTEAGNTSKADIYKGLVINNYPSSKFAQAIVNPNFARDFKARESKIEANFRKAYKAYFQGNFDEVILVANDIDRDYPESQNLPKFKFLKALSEGRKSSTTEFRKSLESFMASFPKDDASIIAKRIIDFIDLQKVSGADMNSPISSLLKDSLSPEQQALALEAKKLEVPIYFFKDSATHYYVIAAKADIVSTSRIKFNLINYNLEYFSNFNFDIQEKGLNKHYNLVILKPLSDSRQAQNYFDLTTISEEIFEGIDKASTEQFIISESNFNALLKDTQLERYTEFFYFNHIK